MPVDRVDHLQQLQLDVRGEVKQRIDQRDKYSIQLTLGLAAIYAFAFSEHGTVRLLFAAPIASLYYTVLILYSYAIHDLLARYLREQIEPAIADATGAGIEREWETWYLQQARSGIRRTFFLWAHWVVTAGTCGIAVYDRVSRNQDTAIDVLLTCILVIASLVVATPGFWQSRHPGSLRPPPPGESQ
jgi:hypothetical protein